MFHFPTEVCTEGCPANHVPSLDGDEIRIKNTFIQNITELVTKEIGNNVQTVSHISLQPLINILWKPC